MPNEASPLLIRLQGGWYGPDQWWHCSQQFCVGSLPWNGSHSVDVAWHGADSKLLILTYPPTEGRKNSEFELHLIQSVEFFSFLLFFPLEKKTKNPHKTPWLPNRISELLLCCSSPLLLIRSSQLAAEQVTVVPPDCNLSSPPKNPLGFLL